MNLTNGAKRRIREHFARNLATFEIIIEVQAESDTRTKIQQFATAHAQRHVFVLRRGEWKPAKLLAGLIG